MGMGGEKIARKPGGCSGPLYKANSNKKAASQQNKWGVKKKNKRSYSYILANTLEHCMLMPIVGEHLGVAVVHDHFRV